MASSTTTVKGLLAVLPFVAYYCVISLASRNGLSAALDGISVAKEPTLPGTTAPLTTHFTGVPAIDHTLVVLITFFWPLLDGRSPAASLQAFHFEGQFLSTAVVLELEARRAGNRWTAFSLITVWLVLGQLFTFAAVTPICLLVHLFVSPTALTSRNDPSTKKASSLTLPASSILALPFAILLGFIVPSVLMTLPSPDITSFSFHQNAIAIWQAFPVWVFVSQFILSSVFAVFLPSITASPSPKQTLARVRPLYSFAIFLSSATHIATWTLSLGSVLLPKLFAPHLVADMHPLTVFVPGLPTSSAPMTSLAAGCRTLLTYDEYIGYTSVLLWSMLVNRNAHVGKVTFDGWGRLVVKSILMSVFLGPGSASTALIWARDEIVLGGVSEEEEESKRKKIA
ncbi:MAG: hypothetical protein M1817_000434 [Caeruleum heppii]|nr:MAG: hypothetical protein M1817_000434 [Caeruleum heppii]